MGYAQRITLSEQPMPESMETMPLQAVINRTPGTRYFRKHVPTNRVLQCVLPATAVLKALPGLNAQNFEHEWNEDRMQDVLRTWGKAAHGTWQYWPAR